MWEEVTDPGYAVATLRTVATQVGDHEHRLRNVERLAWRLTGAAALASFLGAGSAVLVMVRWLVHA
jgi:hypothetical protein